MPRSKISIVQNHRENSTHECSSRPALRVEAALVPKQKLLLIDDSSMIAAATRLLLRGTDLELVSAQSGEDGIALAQTTRPDLILLDVHLPDIDGFETCRRMRAEPWGSHVPIVMASADIGDRERDLGDAAGATDYFEKPFDKQRLVALVARYLDNGRAA